MLLSSNNSRLPSVVTIGGDVTLTRSAPDTLSLMESLIITSPAAGQQALTVAPSVSQSADTLVVTGTPPAAANVALVRLGSALGSSNAAGTWLALNAPALTTADLVNLQVGGVTGGSFIIRGDGAGQVAVGINGAPGAESLRITRNANNETGAVLLIRNTIDGTASGCGVNLTCGTSTAASGFFFCFNGAYTGVASLADRIVVGANSTASGIVLYGPNSGQDVRFIVGSAALVLTVAQTAVTFGEGVNLVVGTTTGSKLGATGGAAGAKLGAFGATPITQPLVATGSTTDQVITALQNLGWFRQS